MSTLQCSRLRAQKKLSLESFVARLRLAYEATINELTMMGKPHRIPHEDSLVPLVYEKAKRYIFLKALSMLQTTENLRE